MRQLPNVITASRIVLTPVIVVLILQNQCSAALPWTLVAGFTDFLDGYLARRLQVPSRAGAYLDPIADKLLLTSLYICFGLSGLVPFWLSALVVGRDLLILAMAAAAFAFTAIRDYPPSIWGKLSTVVQIGASLIFLGRCASPDAVGNEVMRTAIFATAAATGWSGFDYLLRAIRAVR